MFNSVFLGGPVVILHPSVLVLGMWLLAEVVLALHPFDDPVAAVKHPGYFPCMPLEAIHYVILTAHFLVVERKCVCLIGRLIGLLIEGGQNLGSAPLAVIAPPAMAATTGSTSATPATATKVTALLGLTLLGTLPISRGLVLGSDCFPRTPPGISLGLDLVRVHEGQLLYPV